MKAEIIAVGSELLTPDKIDTNSLYITEKLGALGIEVHLKTIVGDDQPLIREIARQAVSRSQLVIFSGGLGPTEDDVTKQAVAEALDIALKLDEAILAEIRQRFAARGLEMPSINAREAMVPEGAIVFRNRVGSAPGFYIEKEGVRVALLPGPPRELKPMFEEQLLPLLEKVAPPRRFVRHTLRIAGLTESKADSLAAPIYTRYRNIRTTILATLPQVELHLTAEATTMEEAEAALGELQRELAAALGDNLFTTRGETLEEVVGKMLAERGETLALAESCTAGLIGERVTRVPGSSRYFLGGVICYSNESKIALCQVPRELIEARGAVSAEVAESLARAVRDLFGSSYGLAVTGIAGPTGGTPEKPVGLTYIALAGPASLEHKRFLFPGDRDAVRQFAAQAALDMLRRRMLR